MTAEQITQMPIVSDHDISIQGFADPVIMRMDPKTKALLLTIRRALIMILGALEDYLCLERSITPKSRRD
jgi:hypothetical protein